MGVPVWGMLPFSIFGLPFFRYGEKWIEATSRVDMGHMLGPKSHVSIASLSGLLHAVTMEIWDRECGLFRPIFALFAILGHVGNTISPWGKGPSHKRSGESCSI